MSKAQEENALKDKVDFLRYVLPRLDPMDFFWLKWFAKDYPRKFDILMKRAIRDDFKKRICKPKPKG